MNFYEEDDATGDKVINAAKQYSMTPIWGFIGIKLNLLDKYYDQKAQNMYDKRANALRKYVSHLNEAYCTHDDHDI